LVFTVLTIYRQLAGLPAGSPHCFLRACRNMTGSVARRAFISAAG
jgi:hypothetical protein